MSGFAIACFIIAACFWLAGQIFFVASIVSFTKGYRGASFRHAIEGLLCVIIGLLVLPS